MNQMQQPTTLTTPMGSTVPANPIHVVAGAGRSESNANALRLLHRQLVLAEQNLFKLSHPREK